MMNIPCNCAEIKRAPRERKRVWNQAKCRDLCGGYGDEPGHPGEVVNETTTASYSMIDWSHAKDAVLSPLHNLLAPPGLPCLTCGKTISDKVTGYPEICSSCYASIPWITSIRCDICGRPVGCPDCSRAGKEDRRFVLNRSVVSYNGMMREWLAQYKFRGNEALGSVLARMTGAAAKRLVKEMGEKTGTARFNFDAVTYVPVSTDRMMERGFNQARNLAVEAANVLGAPLMELLIRSKHTEKQSFKSRWQRLRDLNGVFLPAPEAEGLLYAALSCRTSRGRGMFPLSIFASGKNEFGNAYPSAPIRLLLIDDVYTTGSTVDSCAVILQETCALLGRPVEIYSLTWARS
ncbi:ComF family protein [Paenibacillus sp. FSL R5-0407]|uniref:ComF family protein n=1 Tax=Paenibacillus sp. FSL R5-0407 TaxID=2975320 RepID=UPI0030F4EB13